MSTKIAIALVAALAALASPAFAKLDANGGAKNGRLFERTAVPFEQPARYAARSYHNCGPTQYDSSGAPVARYC